MDQERVAALVELIEHPEPQQRILGDFEGGHYSLGVTLNPENREDLAIRIRVQGDNDRGIPRQVVLDGDTLPVIVHTHFTLPEPLYLPEQRRLRPLICGLQIAHLPAAVAFSGSVEQHSINVGTLGCFVELARGEPGLLSNNHVIADLNQGKRGEDLIVQFGPQISAANDLVAVLGDFEDIEASPPGVTDPRYGGVVYNDIDAAVAELCDEIQFEQRYASFRRKKAPSHAGIGMLGQEVFKVGCATGLTKGVIEDIGTVPVQGYDHTLCHFRRSLVIKVLRDPRSRQSLRNPQRFSDHGDSGSVIVRENGEVVGLLYAGNGQQTYACPIDTVLSNLDCDLI